MLLSKVQFRPPPTLCWLESDLYFLFSCCALCVCAHRDISRQRGKLLRWLQGVSSLAADLWGLGKGSYVTAASAENRPGSVREGQHDSPDRRDGEGGGAGGKEEAKSPLCDVCWGAVKFGR